MTTSKSATTMPHRPVVGIIPATRTMEGGGFPVRRPFPTAQLDHVDPFLLLDEAGPVDWPPGGAIGAPDHPHRGFETVSYVLQGRKQHKDSAGHSGLLGPGDVQWMTAGAGIVHSELPEESFRQAGGTTHGFQIWVNLPARDKMMAPRYQELPKAGIPRATGDDGRVLVRVIAGQALGVEAKIETRTPIMLLHFTLQPGGAIDLPVPAAQRAMAYVFGGEARLGEDAVPAPDGSLAVFGDGELARLAAPPVADNGAAEQSVQPVQSVQPAQPVELLLLAGVPLGEPVARYGPFVMNTREELMQAFQDYEAGRMGTIAPDVSRG